MRRRHVAQTRRVAAGKYERAEILQARDGVVVRGDDEWRHCLTKSIRVHDERLVARRTESSNESLRHLAGFAREHVASVTPALVDRPH